MGFKGLITALLFCISVTVIRAQDTPGAILDAAVNTVNDLFPQTGPPQSWEHQLLFSDNSNLGCPLMLTGKDLDYNIEVYRVTLFYPNGSYPIHVSADTQRVVVCDARILALGIGTSPMILTAPARPTLSQSPTPSSTPSPTATIAWTPQITPSTGYRSRTCSPGLPGYLPSRLQTGQYARLKSPLTLYSNFGRSSATLEELAAGTLSFVLAGPECSEGALVWWQVEQQGRLGWLIESDALLQDYYLQPGVILPGTLPPLPTATPAPAQTLTEDQALITGAPPTTTPTAPLFNVRLRQLMRPTALPASSLMPQFNYTSQTCRAGFDGFLPPRLQVGDFAQVGPGTIPNNVRRSFNLSSERIGEIPNGQIVQILAGPECSAEGFIWWQVDHNGLIGWTVESWLQDDYYLRPYRESPLISFSAPAERITVNNISRVIPLSRVPGPVRDLDWGTDINDYVYLVVALQDSVQVYELMTDGAAGFALQERLWLSEISGVPQVLTGADWGVFFNGAGPVDPWLIWLGEPQVNSLGTEMRIEGIETLALSNQGLLAISRQAEESDARVALWQLPGEPVGEGANFLQDLLHPAIVETLAFSPGGDLLAALAGSNLYLWEVNSGSLRTLRQLSAPAQDLAFVPGRTGQQTQLAYAIGDEMTIWELASGQEYRFQLPDGQGIQQFRFSPLGDLLVIAAMPDAATPTLQSLLVYEASSGRLLHRIEYIGPDLQALSFDPSGRILVAAGSGGAVLYSLP